MNTDKIYAEQLANEYAPKDTSKVVRSASWTQKPNAPQIFLPIPSASSPRLSPAQACAFP